MTRRWSRAGMLLASVAMVAATASAEPVALEHRGVTLHGTIERSPSAPAATALIVAGSGPTDRDGNSALLPGKNNSLRYLAEALAEAGVATLRYDKRLVGQSMAADQKEADLRFEHYADDAAVLSQHLRSRFPDVPHFLLGHSEGGHLILLAARQVPSDGVIILAGPGQHPADLIASQLQGQLPEPLLSQGLAALDQLRRGQTVADAPAALASLLRPSVQPYLISWFRHDPESQLAALSLPSLLIYGSSDIQVPVSDGQRLANAAQQGELVVIDNMNHVLKVVPADAAPMAAYSDPTLPVAPGLVASIVNFTRMPR